MQRSALFPRRVFLAIIGSQYKKGEPLRRQTNMAERKKKATPAPGKVLWKVLLALFALIAAAALELGKHTLLGWGLFLIALAAFIFLRAKKLAGSRRIVRLGAWLCLFIVCGGILLISRPPVKDVPAVQGKNGGVTGVLHTAQGDLTGIYTEDKKVEVYAGIPYAAPPTGDLRWKPPVKPEAWEGVRTFDT